MFIFPRGSGNWPLNRGWPPNRGSLEISITRSRNYKGQVIPIQNSVKRNHGIT